MKKNISILFIACIVFLAGACKKDFLQREPLSDISPENFFNSEKDLKLYTNSFYSAIPSAEGIYNEDVDNIVKGSLGELQTGKRTIPVTGGGWSWGELRKINYFLANYNRKVEAKVAAKHAGVAKFFRAYFYFDKVQRFGEVPWYSTAINQLDTALLKKPRDKRTLIVDSILADINYAIANLPATTSTAEVTRWTALALKSRICLYEGTFRKYHPEFNLPNADALLDTCIAASETLMSGPYSIYTSTPSKAYMELFASINPIQQEIILARTFSNDLQVWHNVNYYTITASYGKPGLEKKLVNSYLMNDGKRFTDRSRYDTVQFFEEIKNRDPRLSQTIRTPGYTRIGNTAKLPPDFGATVTGYQMIKFVADESFDSFNRSINSMPVFRYAEVLLNYAEAKAERGSLTQQDIDKSIKKLRDRVAMPNLILADANALPDPYLAEQYVNATNSPNKGVILEIRRERRIELVMESYRWNDIMRWKEGQLMKRPFKGMYFSGLGRYDLDGDGKIDVHIYTGDKPTVKGPQYLKLDSEISLENNAQGGCVMINRKTAKEFNELRDYLYPVPIQERLLNPNLTQNPEWKDGL